MIFILLTIQLFAITYALQTGYTCEPIVNLTCPDSHKLIVLEVSYSTACGQSPSNYAPSRCIARHREPISTNCNGLTSCSIENTREKNPSFNIDLDSNCDFQGQSINVEYSCIPELKSNELPSIDICSSKSIEKDVREGFIYSPNYPKDYGTNFDCSKTIPMPETGYRLKIYAIRLNTKSIISLQPTGPKRLDDWLEINENGEKISGSSRKSYSLLYEDIIEANLKFKTESITSKQDVIGFLLYFIVTPIRRSRPIATTSLASEAKQSALIIDRKDKQTNFALIVIITLLTAILLVSIVGFLIYKRGNDRRVRYLEEAFQTFAPKNSKDKLIEEMKELSSSSSSNDKFEHIYSDDPLNKINNDSACLYERIDDYDTNKSVL